ncbi:MAG TPA: recombinase family protein [Candidatus Acidoferrum sp.]|jgi:hypothetical protein|nr:recombinase family protein [Candidatus Acidoferrum sp.]
MSEKILPSHIERKACVYIRQSTMQQVRTRLEGQCRQYDLRERAQALGFPRVVVIDEDLGRSGTGSVERPGFGRLLAAVCSGKVGAELTFGASRSFRNNRDWHHLIDLCAMAGTLVIDHDGIYDPSPLNDRLLFGLDSAAAAHGACCGCSQPAVRVHKRPQRSSPVNNAGPFHRAIRAPHACVPTGLGAYLLLIAHKLFPRNIPLVVVGDCNLPLFQRASMTACLTRGHPRWRCQDGSFPRRKHRHRSVFQEAENTRIDRRDPDHLAVTGRSGSSDSGSSYSHQRPRIKHEGKSDDY